MNTNEQLIALRDAHSLKNTDIARMLHVSMYTVRNWLSKSESVNFRHVSEGTIELLRYKLEELSKCT